jgi:hypothetical protein
MAKAAVSTTLNYGCAIRYGRQTVACSLRSHGNIASLAGDTDCSSRRSVFSASFRGLSTLSLRTWLIGPFSVSQIRIAWTYRVPAWRLGNNILPALDLRTI